MNSQRRTVEFGLGWVLSVVMMVRTEVLPDVTIEEKRVLWRCKVG